MKWTLGPWSCFKDFVPSAEILIVVDWLLFGPLTRVVLFKPSGERHAFNPGRRRLSLNAADGFVHAQERWLQRHRSH
jgi:hypothetical protein